MRNDGRGLGVRNGGRGLGVRSDGQAMIRHRHAVRGLPCAKSQGRRGRNSQLSKPVQQFPVARQARQHFALAGFCFVKLFPGIGGWQRLALQVLLRAKTHTVEYVLITGRRKNLVI